MITEIRSHIKEAIRQCSKRYCEIDNPFFNDQDIKQTRLDYEYALIFGASSSTIGNDGLGSVDVIPVNLKLYRQGGRDKLSAFDEGFEHALVIRDLILDRAALIGKEYIKGITSSSVTPSEVVSSQDVYAYETNFNVTISYGIGD